MELLTDKQLCLRFGVSRLHTRKQRIKNLLPYRLVGERIHYTESDIAEWIENCKRVAEQQHATRYSLKKRVVGRPKQTPLSLGRINRLEQKREQILRQAGQA